MVSLDQGGAEVAVRGDPDWQPVTLFPADCRDIAGNVRTDWLGIRELRLLASQQWSGKVNGVETRLELGVPWKGAAPPVPQLALDAPAAKWLTGPEIYVHEHEMPPPATKRPSAFSSVPGCFLREVRPVPRRARSVGPYATNWGGQNSS